MDIVNHFEEYTERIKKISNELKTIQKEPINILKRRDIEQKKLTKSLRIELMSEVEKLTNACTFEMTPLLKFIKYVVEVVEKEKYQIIKTDNKFYISSKSGKKADIVLDNQFEINLLMAGLLKTHQSYPYLSEMLRDTINYKIEIGSNTEQSLSYMKDVVMIDYYELITGKKFFATEEERKLIKELLQDIHTPDMSWKKIEFSKEEAKELVKELIEGKYHSLFEKGYWFEPEITYNILVYWKKKREELKNSEKRVQEITLENYIAFVNLYIILNHINGLKKGDNKTPLIEPENQKIKELIKEVLSTNYNWREVREITKMVNTKLKTKENKIFPNNIEEIKDIFHPQVTTYFDKLNSTKNLQNDTRELRKKAKKIKKAITPNNIYQLFLTPAATPIDKYLRKMILSQFDFQKIEQTTGLTEKKVISVLNSDLTLPSDIIKKLFSNRKQTEILTDLTEGIISSLTKSKKINDMLQEAKKVQETYGLWYGISIYDRQGIKTEDGNYIISTPYERINNQYAGFQRQYEFFYENTSDLEFVEGCVELLGDIMMTQIFEVGNKRTAKALFNEMLLSRNIIPPAIDLNENDSALWYSFEKEREKRYEDAKIWILTETIKVNEQLKNGEYHPQISTPIIPKEKIRQ